MEEYKGKMREFILKLWTNPNIQMVPLAKKENHILNFVKENQKSLMEAFASETFFPKINFDDAVRLLLNELPKIIFESVTPVLDTILEKTNHPELREHFTNQGGLTIDTLEFRNYILNIMHDKKMRELFLNVLTIIDAKFYERYTPIVIELRKLIFIELVRRDKLTMAPNIISDYLNLASLFRPLAYHMDKSTGQSGAVIKLKKDSKNYKKIINQLNASLNDKIGFIPQLLLVTGLDSTLHVNDNPEVSGASRLINIFSTRAQEFVPNLKQDRGAETPDKSWFNINRRSAKHSGMDIRFLEELYLVAGEEGW